MAADLHIHVLKDPCTEGDLARFFRNTLGSKYFSWFNGNDTIDFDNPDGSWAHVMNTPQVWVGEVSWLKAMVYQDAETFVPPPVAQVSDLIGEELPVLTPELRAQILDALGLANDTGYDTSDREPIGAFLDQHMGERLFTVSW